MGKVIDRKDIIKEVKKLKSEGKKVVFTNGCFDILHLGHAKYLNESSKYGDILIVGVNSDNSVKRLKGESRPINKELDRANLLCYLKCVDYAVIFEEDTPENLLSEIKPNIYTKGADYTLETLKEAKVVMENNGEVKFIDLVQGKSTTNIINSIGASEKQP